MITLIFLIIFLPLIITICVIISICRTSSNTRENVRQLNSIQKDVNSIANTCKEEGVEGYEISIKKDNFCLGRQRYSDSKGIEKYQELKKIFEKYNAPYEVTLKYIEED